MKTIVTLIVLLGSCLSPGTADRESKEVGTDQTYHQDKAKSSDQEPGWKGSAEKMVEEQIRQRGISDEDVLRVMKTVPRHKFVPMPYDQHAYEDRPLPIGNDQTISQPYIVALMTDLLALQGDEKVLEIGTGSGYQAAILGELAGEVYTIEIVEELANSSKNKLEEMGYSNVHVRHGNGYKGWPEKAPFDRVIVTAAPEEIPEALKEQMKVGGKMVLPVGDRFQELKVLTKKDEGEFAIETITGVRFVPMVEPIEED